MATHSSGFRLPGESQGWRSLLGCHLWGHRVGHDLVGSDLAAAAAADIKALVKLVYLISSQLIAGKSKSYK